MSMKAELVVDARAATGEGPVWHAGQRRLWWVDIAEKGALHVHDPLGESDRVYCLGLTPTAVGPRRAGGMVLATADGFADFDPATGRVLPIVDVEPNNPNTRMNDGKCDSRGRFWAGTMSKNHQPGDAALYCLDVNRTVRQMRSGVTTSNGLGWSPDDTVMYHIDTFTKTVSAFDFDAERGTIANGRTIISFADQPGKPDGMTVDVEGMLWIAHWNGGRVSRWNPGAGEKLGEILVPAPRTSSCAFGGLNLDRLYVTTARFGLTEEQLREYPHSGGLFVVEPGVGGLPANFFGG